MNYSVIARILSLVLKVELLFMAIPLCIALFLGEDLLPFGATMLLLAVCCALLSAVKSKTGTIYPKEGFAATALTWITLSLFGCLPFLLSGYFGGFFDAFFEAVSGFTTTGSTVLGNVEILPKSILFWRSFAHWLGGMGIIVFVLAFMSALDSSSINLLQAESPGPEPGKIVPKIRETTKTIYLIYLSLTVILILLLRALGLPWFDAFIHAMGSAGTGGFSCLNASVGGYNNVAVEVAITVFTFLFGVNFTLYFWALRKDFKSVFQDEELRLYTGIVLTAIVLVCINIYHIYGTVGQALRHASFQVVTIVTTTGYASTDFDLWPWFSKAVLVLLMLTGCCAGSTGGGLKMIRLLEIFKAAKTELYRITHPQVVRTVKINGHRVDSAVMQRNFVIFFFYGCFLIGSTIIVCADGSDLITASTATMSALSNIGPGLALVGPSSNFGHLSDLSKFVLSFCMLAGRLEFIPMLVLLSPSSFGRRR